MARLPHDYSLRRALVRLSKLPEADFDAILATLEDDQRSRALHLLANLDGKAQLESEIEIVSDYQAVALPEGLSPWLIARINGYGEDGLESADQFVLTPHAQKTLHRLAVASAPQPERPKRNPSLFGRIWRGRAGL
jgi:hypothetical protein